MQKVKQWLKATGISNIGYAAAAIGALALGMKLAAGACIGVFVYINFNVIQKLVKETIDKW